MRAALAPGSWRQAVLAQRNLSIGELDVQAFHEEAL